MRLTFCLRKPSSKKETPINCFVHWQQQQMCIATGVSIHPKQWDRKRKRARKGIADEATVNDRLTKIEKDIRETFSKLAALGEPLTADSVRQRYALVSGKLSANSMKVPDFFTVFNAFIDDPAQRPARIQGERTLMIYSTVRDYVKEFSKAYGVRITWETLNLLFFQKFVSYLVTVKGNNNTTLDKTMERLRAFLRYCDEVRGIPMCRDYQRFTGKDLPKAEQSRKVYLTTTELQHLANLDLSSNDRLRKVRDCFLFLAHTGLRYSDLQQLRPEHRKGDSLELVTTKNKKAITLPLHPVARRIFDMYEGRLPKISNQKFNDYVQEICQQAEVDEPCIVVDFAGSTRNEKTKPKYELISAHSAKRSFVTNNLQAGMSIETLCKLTGNNRDTIQKYIVPTEEDARREVAEVWQ